jgi:hypothetical protein
MIVLNLNLNLNLNLYPIQDQYFKSSLQILKISPHFHLLTIQILNYFNFHLLILFLRVFN